MRTKSLPTVEALRREFVRQLRLVLTPHELASVIQRNRDERDPRICHTHDYCDPNQVMVDALETLGVEESRCMDDDVMILFDRAWNSAKAREFAI